MAYDSFVGFVFGGAVFFFMGLSLACDAEHNAQAAVNWERLTRGAAAPPRPASSRARLVLAYRLGGLAFCVLGLALAAAARFQPALLLSRFGPAAMSPFSRLAGGLLLIAMSLLLGSFKVAELAKPSRLPEGLADAPTAADWSRRAAVLSGWLVIACLLAFGVFLVSRRS